MNEELLDTPVVKSQIRRYLSEDYILEHILKRLEEIHLIKISKQKLLLFIREKNLDETLKLEKLENTKDLNTGESLDN